MRKKEFIKIVLGEKGLGVESLKGKMVSDSNIVLLQLNYLRRGTYVGMYEVNEFGEFKKVIYFDEGRKDFSKMNIYINNSIKDRLVIRARKFGYLPIEIRGKDINKKKLKFSQLFNPYL